MCSWFREGSAVSGSPSPDVPVALVTCSPEVVSAVSAVGDGLLSSVSSSGEVTVAGTGCSGSSDSARSIELRAAGR